MTSEIQLALVLRASFWNNYWIYKTWQGFLFSLTHNITISNLDLKKISSTNQIVSNNNNLLIVSWRQSSPAYWWARSLLLMSSKASDLMIKNWRWKTACWTHRIPDSTYIGACKLYTHWHLYILHTLWSCGSYFQRSPGKQMEGHKIEANGIAAIFSSCSSSDVRIAETVENNVCSFVLFGVRRCSS